MALRSILSFFFVLSAVSLVFGETLKGCDPLQGVTCLTIGFTYSGTGSLRPEGLETKNGYVLWANRLNQAGGISKGNITYKIDLEFYDDQSDPNVAAQLYQQMINNNSSDFFLGPYGSSITQQVLTVTNSTNKLLVFGSAASEDTFSQGFNNIFGVSTTTKHYLEPLLAALKARGVINLALAYSVSGFTTQAAQGASAWMAKNDFSLVGDAVTFSVNPSESEMTDVLDRLKGYQAGGAAVLGLLRDGELIVNVSKKIGFQPKALILTSAPSEPDFVAKMGADANHILGPAQWHPHLNHSDELFGTAQEFADLYKAAFNETVSFKGAQAAAAGFVLGLAIGNSSDLSQEAVAESVRALNRATFFGHVSFNTTGENIGKPMLGIQIMDGAIEIVAPESLKEFDVIYPRLYPNATETQTQPPATTTPAATNTTSVTTSSPTGTTPGNNTDPEENFTRCVNVISGNFGGLNWTICFNVDFEGCDFKLSTTFEGRTLGNPQTFPITEFKEAFKEQETCSERVLFNCQICTWWTNLTLNETHAAGCGQMDIHCFNLNFPTYDLGCFSNTEVVPRCFGSCPESCHLHGTCENGFCRCQPDWKGDSCDQPITVCPNECGGSVRGQCIDGKCVCSERFEGEDCSSYIGQGSSDDGKSSVVGYAVGFVLGGIALIVIVVAVIYYRRRKQSRRSFGHLRRRSSVSDSNTHSLQEEEELGVYRL